MTVEHSATVATWLRKELKKESSPSTSIDAGTYQTILKVIDGESAQTPWQIYYYRGIPFLIVDPEYSRVNPETTTYYNARIQAHRRYQRTRRLLGEITGDDSVVDADAPMPQILLNIQDTSRAAGMIGVAQKTLADELLKYQYWRANTCLALGSPDNPNHDLFSLCRELSAFSGPPLYEIFTRNQHHEMAHLPIDDFTNRHFGVSWTWLNEGTVDLLTKGYLSMYRWFDNMPPISISTVLRNTDQTYIKYFGGYLLVETIAKTLSPRSVNHGIVKFLKELITIAGDSKSISLELATTRFLERKGITDTVENRLQKNYIKAKKISESLRLRNGSQ